ncbi:Plasmodium vivax Vir protein, putative [Plasmodium vivax]|uniref:Vir protein, putative n=1 Tax=Plasmodium vivax TaxID=5855 RepID=A0A1G4E839_PLAVI|nr:Plasmodium vivax Vir protein, putative [Plasmodium vivax]
MYNTANSFLIYRKILEEWDPVDIKSDSGECFGFNHDYTSQYHDTFTKEHCLQAVHYLSTVESTIESQYLSNGCKYFLYWLYNEVLKKKIDNHKVINIYQDVLKGYIEGSANENFRNYVNFFSERTIENLIKLTEMYESFYKFKGDIHHTDNKCDNAKECVRLYNENIKVCEEGDDYDFCYELDNLKESYDTYMKSNESCPNSPKTLESYRLFNPTVVIITPFSILLVISLSLFFLYKFTPFGSFFQKGTKNKKKIPGNVDYEMQVPSHASQRVNKYNKNRQYNISYLSSGQ